MDYICLAAGQGSRFGRLGTYLQKCMYPIALQPFLEYSIRNLRHSATLDLEQDCLILVVGHHAEQVRRYFGDSYDGLSIHYVEQAQPLGTGHAIYTAWEAVGCDSPLLDSAETVIVWLADLYVKSSLFEAVAHHPMPNVQTIAPGPDDENPNVRVSFNAERITTAWRGDSEQYDIGLWKLSPAVVRGMTSRKVDEFRVMPNLQHALENGAAIGYVQADEWIHLGGTRPTASENVQQVAQRVLELEVNP